MQLDTGTHRDPIFILGITERSGTNVLFHLLALQPDCAQIARQLVSSRFTARTNP